MKACSVTSLKLGGFLHVRRWKKRNRTKCASTLKPKNNLGSKMYLYPQVLYYCKDASCITGLNILMWEYNLITYNNNHKLCIF